MLEARWGSGQAEMPSQGVPLAARVRAKDGSRREAISLVCALLGVSRSPILAAPAEERQTGPGRRPMRPLMLLLLSVPLLIGALVLVDGQTFISELLLPPHTQWTWAHKLRAAGFASDCKNTVWGASAQVTTDVLSDGRVRMSCDISGVHHLPGVG